MLCSQIVYDSVGMLFNFIQVYILWILLYLLYLFFSPLVGGANKINK